MKKLALVALFLPMCGCTKFLQDFDNGCALETTAHDYYVQNIAPTRPASAVANELKLYNIAMAACSAVDATYPQIQAALAAVKQARSQ